jgi:hypothetical protein
MNPFEDMLITMGITAVRAAIKNPAHAAKLQTQLLEVANDIYAEYGLVPPSAPSAPAK